MRATLLVALLVAGSALALTPSALATGPCMPEEPCDPPPYQPPTPDCRKVPDREPLVVVTEDCDIIVTADLFSCPFGRDWFTTTYGPLTVTYAVCRQPVEEQSMADPFPTCVTEPCGPSLPRVPDVACLLKENTPATLLHPLWGYSTTECVLYAHTACTGGASGSYDRRVAFIDVSVAKCSGGPAWS